METLRQLISRDLEDGWSQDSDDTPTNETANERSPFTDRPGAELPDPAPSESPGQWGEEPVEAPPLEVLHSPVQVVRKGKRSMINNFMIIVLEQNIVIGVTLIIQYLDLNLFQLYFD